MRQGKRDLLAACQVDQVELPGQLQLRLHVLLLDVYEEDAVAARAVLVHVCRTKRQMKHKHWKTKLKAWSGWTVGGGGDTIFI